MADPEKTIRDSIRHTLDGWPAGPFTHAENCQGCRIATALDQLVALLAEKDEEYGELLKDWQDAQQQIEAMEQHTEADPPTRLDRRTRETLEAAGRAISEAEVWIAEMWIAAPISDDEEVPAKMWVELRDAQRQIVHLLAEDEGEPPVVLTNREGKSCTCHRTSVSMCSVHAPYAVHTEQTRCTGYCIFDGDALTHPDLCCPIHGSEAQAKAGAAGLDRVEWMRACRASWPFAPAAVLTIREEEKL